MPPVSHIMVGSINIHQLLQSTLSQPRKTTVKRNFRGMARCSTLTHGESFSSNLFGTVAALPRLRSDKRRASRTQPRASFQWLRKTLQSMMATIVEISKQVRTVSPPDLWDGWVGSLSRKPYTMARSCLHLPVHALPDAIHSLTENLLIEPLTIEELFTNATMSIVPMVAKNFAKRDGPDGHHHLKSGSKPAPSPRKAVPNRNVHTIGREAKSGWAQSNKSRRPKFCKEPQGTFVHEIPQGCEPDS